ncbi:MAG: 16S rRNA (guanine(527)-N(7))-methyltransferase RsmG, partial [Magnetococcales bacterium]|nr:16S rRNA (guanine(527)-N(7))-methyltransferase RsmG [Magnetococcales bacterium]
QHLLTWNQSFNLIGPSAISTLLNRHILDSITLTPYLKTPAKIADIGSGAGFPALILAILSNPSQQYHLYESSQKKSRFLNFIVEELQLNNRVTIHPKRAEEHSSHSNTFDIVTSRALGSLQLIAKLSKHLLHPNGICLALKGRNVQEEINQFLNAPIAQFFNFPTLYNTPEKIGDGVIIQMQRVSRETNSAIQ